VNGHGDLRQSKWLAARHRYGLMLGCIFVIGAYLRLHLLSSQILMDDEWHSIRAVTGKKFLEVLTAFDPVNNSSLPLNLYNLALYHTVGWSEFSIRLSIMLAGLLSLVVLPLQIKQLLNARVSIVFACLLAISPFLVFYSRYDRPYGITVLLCFSALLFSHQWLSTGKFSYALGFFLAGLFAIYTNLLSMMAVAAPFVVVIGCRVLYRLRPSSGSACHINVSTKNLFQVAALFALLLLPYLWPVLWQSARLPWAGGRLTLMSVLNAATLLSGTTHGVLPELFFMFLIAGFTLLDRDHRLLGAIFLATIFAYAGFLLFSRPLGLDAGAILLRYAIVVVPISFTAVAVAVDDLLKAMENINRMPRAAPSLCAAGLLICLYAYGPLPDLYVPPNNLANHAIFQSSYERKTWENTDFRFVYPSFVIRRDEIPPFYNWLGGQSNVAAIVEYPFDLCSYNNLFYFYQHFHRKRILAGYCSDPALVRYSFAPLSGGSDFHCQVGKMDADEVLSAVEDQSKLSFRNMVDVTDTNALLSSAADLLVVHKDIMAELTVWKDSPRNPSYDRILMHYRSVDQLQARFKNEFGAPIYEDAHLLCFQIRPPRSPREK
jgi:uncharacterized membrane protein